MYYEAIPSISRIILAAANPVILEISYFVYNSKKIKGYNF